MNITNGTNNTNTINDRVGKVKDFVKNKVKFDKRTILILLCVFVVIFFISLIFTVKNSIDFFSKVHSSDAVVVSVTENNDNTYGSYNYEIEFYDNQNNYCSNSINSDIVYDVDDYVKIYYNNSKEVYLTRSNPLVVIISIISLVAIIGLFFVYKHKPKPVVDNNTKRIKKLIKANNYVTARIDNVVRNDNNQNKYYNIICKWNDSKEDRDYTFVSEDLDFDPTMSIRVSNSSSLKVYIDKNNYDNYFVDVNEIKNNRI